MVKLARATGGSTTRNTEEMRLTGTGKRRINTVVRLEAKEEEAPAAELEHVQVEAELELDQAVAAELELDQAVAAELGHDPAAVELELGQVALALVRVEVALELVPVAAELARVQVAVPPRTRSVTAVHRRGLVPLLAAEVDLVAVAEIMHEPVATEAVVAWAAVATAGVVAVVEAAE